MHDARDRPDSDPWRHGEAYERYVGRWSRLVAPGFLDWLGMAPGRRWLDVGCGTGSLCEAILARCDPAAVVGVDPSDGFLETARSALGDRVDFRLGDGAHLPLADHSVDVVVSGLVLNFVPDLAAALAEMARVTRRGGAVAAYVWDYADRMELMQRFWDAAAALDHDAVDLAESLRFRSSGADGLRAAFTAAGLGSPELSTVEITTVFADFDDYWMPFLGGQGPAPAYAMALPEDRRDALRERLRSTLPVQPDGSIALAARAILVRGRVED
ncbi:MAG: class I SAM-dependent methyltransferase [Leifsonia sp.]